jgi:hypothetical protein
LCGDSLPESRVTQSRHTSNNQLTCDLQVPPLLPFQHKRLHKHQLHTYIRSQKTKYQMRLKNSSMNNAPILQKSLRAIQPTHLPTPQSWVICVHSFPTYSLENCWILLVFMTCNPRGARYSTIFSVSAQHAVWGSGYLLKNPFTFFLTCISK